MGRSGGQRQAMPDLISAGRSAMERGMSVTLSENEQITLRRVSYGIAKREDLRPQDLLRLAALKLITDGTARPELTQLGRERLATLRGLDTTPTSENDWATHLIDKLK